MNCSSYLNRRNSLRHSMDFPKCSQIYSHLLDIRNIRDTFVYKSWIYFNKNEIKGWLERREFKGWPEVVADTILLKNKPIQRASFEDWFWKVFHFFSSFIFALGFIGLHCSFMWKMMAPIYVSQSMPHTPSPETDDKDTSGEDKRLKNHKTLDSFEFSLFPSNRWHWNASGREQLNPNCNCQRCIEQQFTSFLGWKVIFLPEHWQHSRVKVVAW